MSLGIAIACAEMALWPRAAAISRPAPTKRVSSVARLGFAAPLGYLALDLGP
jgi:hypothetical protein